MRPNLFLSSFVSFERRLLGNPGGVRRESGAAGEYKFGVGIERNATSVGYRPIAKLRRDFTVLVSGLKPGSGHDYDVSGGKTLDAQI
jgi:hypothetical protein